MGVLNDVNTTGRSSREGEYVDYFQIQIFNYDFESLLRRNFPFQCSFLVLCRILRKYLCFFIVYSAFRFTHIEDHKRFGIVPCPSLTARNPFFRLF